MKTIYEKSTLLSLTERITTLPITSSAKWGKMNCYQMLKHCTMSEEMFLGKTSYKRLFIGRLFGKMALSGILKNDVGIKKNQPTHPDLKITGTGDASTEKLKWIELLNGYAKADLTEFTHPFFGKMTKDQIGKYVYKHTDHHLNQFGG